MRPRTAAILQPNYLPWVGTFDLIDRVDVWVWLDTVQYTKNDWRNRNRIAPPRGEPFWLTLPVQTHGRLGQTIAEATLDPRQDWAKRHLRSLEQAYAQAPSGPEVVELLRPSLEARPARLVDVTVPTCEALSRALGCETEFVLASRLATREEGRNERVLAICAEVGAARYVSGPAARAYMDEALFRERGVEVVFADYAYPPYPRGAHPPQDRLSAVDAFAWLGFARTREFLRAHSCVSPA
ncbi:MAG: WbqC family protein [Planctomycetota bacterium]